METGTIKLDDIRSDLDRQARVNCRLMLRKSEQNWKLQAMIADAPAVSSAAFSYDYGHIAFVGGTVKGSRLASWLLRRKGGIRHFHFVIPKLQENINWQRYPSHVSRNVWLRIPQPFSLHTISITERDQRQHDSSLLVKESCPSFRNVAAAATELMYGELASSRQIEPDEIQVRIAHREAWIEQVQLHATAASMRVEGTNVAGTRLEVNAQPEKFERRLRKAGSRRFSFKRGVPERLWIVLSRNGRWLDYRDLDLRGNRMGTEGNVVIDPADDCAQIEGFISRGERETIEFKQEVSNDKGTSFLRTVAAFANGKGGVILLGVVNGTGEVKGISGDVQREKDRISNLIHSVLVPQPEFRLENCRIEGRQVIALFIEEGDSRPYGLYPANPRYCIRRGATTFPATQGEVRALAQKGQTDSILPFLSM